jgi:hypothetical protein
MRNPVTPHRLAAIVVVWGTVASAIALLGTARPPIPAPSDPPTPLKEIGRVRASVCSTIVVHANAAIDDALANDSDLRGLIVALTTADMDDATDLKKHNTYHDLELAAAKVRETALDGEGEVRRLRALAADSPEPRKSDLKAFADALGEALYRQRMMAIDAQRLASVQHGREEKANDDARFANDAAHYSRIAPRPTQTEGPIAPPPPSIDKAFKLVAADFADRSKLVTVDEGVAADHGLGATTGC